MNTKNLHIATFALSVTGLLAGLPAKIEVSGSAADKKAWNDKVEHCRKHNAWFKAWYDKIANSPKVVKVVLVRSKKAVIIDSFATDEVDLDDIDVYPELDPPTTLDQCQQIVHILEERFQAVSTPRTAAQTWRQWFEASHAKATKAENDYRASLGYTDKIVEATLSADGKKICYEWKLKNGDKVYTYVPIADGRTEGRVRHIGGGTLSDGRRYFDVEPVPGNANGTLTLPPSLGGETLQFKAPTGLIRFAVKQSREFPAFNEVELIALDLVAPPTRRPSGGSVGSTWTFMRKSVYGWHHPATGQLVVAYDGVLANQSLLTANTFDVLTGTVDLNSTSDFKFHIATALLINEATHAVPTIKMMAPPRLGTSLPIMVESPVQPGMAYLTLFSFGDVRRPELPDGRRLPIEIDALTLMSLEPRGLFQGVIGNLDARGRGMTTVQLPSIPSLSGLELMSCLVTFDDLPNAVVADVSKPISIRLVR